MKISELNDFAPNGMKVSVSGRFASMFYNSIGNAEKRRYDSHQQRIMRAEQKRRNKKIRAIRETERALRNVNALSFTI